jgi:hypothetical protein
MIVSGMMPAFTISMRSSSSKFSDASLMRTGARFWAPGGGSMPPGTFDSLKTGARK